MSAEIEKFHKQHKDATELLRRLLPEMIEHAGLIARYQKAQFDAYLAEEFTVDQALYLTKSGGGKP